MPKIDLFVVTVYLAALTFTAHVWVWVFRWLFTATTGVN
jgi:hypothetical protein